MIYTCEGTDDGMCGLEATHEVLSYLREYTCNDTAMYFVYLLCDRHYDHHKRRFLEML